MKMFWTFVFSASLCFGVTSVAVAQTALDYEAVRNHVTCYPFGIDKIGQGKMEEGTAIWNSCFTTDFNFRIYLGYGEPIVCPGEKCALPEKMNSIEKRAEFAKNTFERAKFVKTSHHLTNVTISFENPNLASVKAYIQAWHWRGDGSAIIAPGEWDVKVSRTAEGWRINEESLSIVGAGLLQPPK